ncbi:MAG: FAD-dependent oxidoreductase [Pseudomonadota bacterium]
MLDALVIGGGFYGVSIACYLAERRGLGAVRVVEREGALFTRASYTNQARVHNGYHYPRSFLTAYRSRLNLPLFVRDYPFAVVRDFTKLYAIARRNSKVNARQFVRFCREIGARLEPAPAAYRDLMSPKQIEAAFLVEEYAFDAARLARWAGEALGEAGVEVSFGRRVVALRAIAGGVEAEIADGAGRVETVRARTVFNCTYSGLNQFAGGPLLETRLKHEVTELALVDLPPPLDAMGLTVMDGPFFSAMPFPARGLHSLTHVRYTPHFHWFDTAGRDPYAVLDGYHRESRVDLMLRDACRYLPALEGARYQGSLFEVKTVLVKSESDDGRPILMERSQRMPGLYSILGGKIDNIYDILGQLDREAFGRAAA